MVRTWNVSWTVMDLNGMIHADLDPVYEFINSVRPVAVQIQASEEMEPETVTAPPSGQSQNTADQGDDVVPEPTPKINKIDQSDVLDIRTPFDPEIQEPTGIDQRVEREPLICFEKPICYETESIRPNPNVPLGTGEFPFHRELDVPPKGQIAVEFLPFLPAPKNKAAVPPIFRWAAIIRHHPSDPPLKSAAQRRQIFQAAIKKVPYSRAVRGREYADRGAYEWKTCLGYVYLFIYFKFNRSKRFVARLWYLKYWTAVLTFNVIF